MTTTTGKFLVTITKIEERTAVVEIEAANMNDARKAALEKVDECIFSDVVNTSYKTDPKRHSGISVKTRDAWKQLGIIERAAEKSKNDLIFVIYERYQRNGLLIGTYRNGRYYFLDRISLNIFSADAYKLSEDKRITKIYRNEKHAPEDYVSIYYNLTIDEVFEIFDQKICELSKAENNKEFV